MKTTVKSRVKSLVARVPVVGDLIRRLYSSVRANLTKPAHFPGSAEYWEGRYSAGHNSGAGSYGLLAEFKAEVINDFVRSHQIQTIIEFGCGDGHQLSLAEYPSYIGFDVSNAAITRCKSLFASDGNKSFRMMIDYDGEQADLVLSLDVIYHLVEDGIFQDYMRRLFDASRRYLIIYSSDFDNAGDYGAAHIRHRNFTAWIRRNAPNWKLTKVVNNRYPYRGDDKAGSFADFHFYERTPVSSIAEAQNNEHRSPLS